MKTLKEVLQENCIHFENISDCISEDIMNEECIDIIAKPMYEESGYEGLDRLSGWLFEIITENRTLSFTADTKTIGGLSILRPITMTERAQLT